jgi:hypothetical protein
MSQTDCADSEIGDVSTVHGASIEKILFTNGEKSRSMRLDKRSRENALGVIVVDGEGAV